MNLMAIAHGHRGDLDEAERLYAQALVLRDARRATSGSKR